tara:strand:+ start:1536 stop:2147 length:612 start_codon:yes stop_codon:yes gene_type:complete
MKSRFPEGIITSISGRCFVLNGDDIDTDRIIPARFLKCISFQDLGDKVFADDRKEIKGSHPFDLKKNQGASILIVESNFGCGSSREHAPQALMRWGIRALVGISFAEIFYGNCLALGIPCATTTSKNINSLKELLKKEQSKEWTLNINKQIIHTAGENINIKIEPGPQKMFTTGRWDATSQLMSNEEELNKTMKNLPYLNNFE